MPVQQQGPAHSLSASSNGEQDNGMHITLNHWPHEVDWIIRLPLCGTWHVQ